MLHTGSGAGDLPIVPLLVSAGFGTFLRAGGPVVDLRGCRPLGPPGPQPETWCVCPSRGSKSSKQRGSGDRLDA